MKKLMTFGFASFLLFLSGCTTFVQNPVPLKEEFWQQKDTKIGVALTTIPQPDTHEVGAGCLLCLATVAAANSTLTGHVETLSTDDISSLNKELADYLKSRELQPVLIEEAINFKTLEKFKTKVPDYATLDFRKLKDKYGIDKLLVIEVIALGTFRTYASYVPTSDPVGTFRAAGYVIDLETNGLDWYRTFVVNKAVDGEWDEPEEFPGITNAYYQAIEEGMQQIKAELR